MEIELELKYTRAGVWHTISVLTAAMMEILKTGLFENRPVHAVKMWTITGEDGEKACLVYEILNAKSGGQPWEMTT